ncbi:MAG TPA: hypothetical protein VNA26_07170 [Chitinophagaceae bacterium]|nr:hypothetical protein [Chitinophagaceae bacterium]
MTELFDITLTANNQPVAYSVFFADEEYHFQSTDAETAESFIIKRERDEWHTKENIDNELKNNAIAVLEKYLLSQH